MSMKQIESDQDHVALRRRLWLVAVVALAAVMVHHSRLGGMLQDVQRLRDEVDAWGVMAPLLAVPVLSMLIAVGMPRSVFNGLSGLLFGVPMGMVVAHAGNLLGNFAMYHAMVWFGRGLPLQRLERKAWFTRLRRRGGVFDVVMVRLVPVNALVQNAALVAAEVRPGPFWLGTLIGLLPSTLVAVLLGSGIAEDSMRDALLSVAVALAIVVLLTVLAWRWSRRQGNNA